jgi:nucleotide-binding universal stress UspA family protein
MKVLLAIDGSETSHAAVDEVAHRPWPPGTTIKLFSVLELPFTPTPETWALPESYYSKIEAATKEQAEAAVTEATAQLRAGLAAQTEIITEMRPGLAKNEIIHEAEQWGADLIVIGSHGYKGWQRFLLGSVSQAVAAHAPCSVEIVRHPEAKAAKAAA